MDDSKLSTEQILLMDWVLAPERPTAVSPAPAPTATPRRPIREREQRATSWRPEFQPEFYAVPGTEVAPGDVATSARMAALLGFYNSQPFAAPRSFAGDGVRAIARLGRAWLIRYRPLLEKDPAIPLLAFDWTTEAYLSVFADRSSGFKVVDQVRGHYRVLIGYQTGRNPEIGTNSRTIAEMERKVQTAVAGLHKVFSGLAYQRLITAGERDFMTHHVAALVTMPEVYQLPNG